MSRDIPDTLKFDFNSFSPADRRDYKQVTGYELDDAWQRMLNAFQNTEDGQEAALSDLPDDLFVPFLWIVVRQSDASFTIEDAWHVPYSQWSHIQVVESPNLPNAPALPDDELDRLEHQIAELRKARSIGA